ncbi:7-carboxy-7-deazaguanine synthase QueE [Candidatus Woesearchaeota archaeon]|nr:7-carboxy-7-deazaguanine synthase QueE [Candidatus Woesearchaeota archaeon]
MFIAETFYSIQGEGKYIGVPSFFIRSSGCNLRCEWRDVISGEITKCDTPYTSWNPQGTSRSIDELIQDVRQTPARHVVVTGGEPFLQRYLPQLAEELTHFGYPITIETNGTIFRELPQEVYLSISPKTRNSVPYGSKYEKEHLRQMRNIKVLKKLMARHEYQFKFVVVAPGDIYDIKQLQEELIIPAQYMYLMPEGDNSEVIRTRSRWIVEMCKTLGFNFSDRLHIHLWHNERGF